MKIVINLHGIGCSIESVKIPALIINEVMDSAQKLDLTIDEVIFDNDFNKKFVFQKQSMAKGLFSHKKSQIEIRINGRKKRMIYFSELVNTDLYLFPMFDVEIKTMSIADGDQVVFYAVEKETGLISSFKLHEERFDMEKMKYELRVIKFLDENFVILSNIRYNGKILKNRYSDTLIIENYVKK
jgi:hypothetical protein